MKYRNIGVDIYRILCCIGVLSYRVIDDILAGGRVLAKALYYGASYCVPGFFLLADFLISKKGKLSVEYNEEKICKAAIHFIRTGEILLKSIFTGSRVRRATSGCVVFVYI